MNVHDETIALVAVLYTAKREAGCTCTCAIEVHRTEGAKHYHVTHVGKSAGKFAPDMLATRANRDQLIDLLGPSLRWQPEHPAVQAMTNRLATRLADHS